MSDARATGVRDGGIAARLAELRARAAAAAERAGRSPAEVTLIGVAKRQPAARVVAAVAAGLGDVAENFVQEARDKLPAVREALAARGLAAPRFHLVGRLQTNKARTAAPLFDCVQSVDRLELARELARRAEAAGRTLDALVQVNLSGEPQKGGVAPDGLAALLDACAERNLGVLVDHVPNHMSVARPELNEPWWAMLRDGPGSVAAAWFDVEWTAAAGKVILPVLGEPLDAVVDRFEQLADR